MYYYLLVFGLVVVILISLGVFYSIKEFKEMSEHPEEYKTNGKTNIRIRK